MLSNIDSVALLL
jgi:hypothetical protein